MPTPKQGYRLKDGSRVPGVTTILSRFKDSGGLIRWAYNMGKEGRDMDAERDAAADAGTLVHAWVDAFVCGREREPVPNTVASLMLDKAESGFGAFKHWWDMSRVEIIATEQQLVSEDYRYGGTPDAIGKINNALVVIDWKTSNAIYSEMLVQLAAYANLWEEETGYKIQGFHLCRFAKEHGDFSHHYWKDLSSAWRQFVLFRQAYELDKELKKRAA